MKVLGIESTAHTFGVGAVDRDEVLANVKKMYEPEEGGIHPREAAEQHYQEAPVLLQEAVEEAGVELADFDGIAFSRGPGMGQTLDVGAVAARRLALEHDLPLVGVNHCIAHVTVGTRTTGSEHPTTLYVSGGNTQLIEYRSGRYRVVGETQDVALGNALDKLAREMRVPHPGGPEIELMAGETEEIEEMSYPVKGMDLSFSGLVTEARRMLDSETEELVANSFQEHAYAACVEALERAMARSGSGEALLTGGVAANSRFREMVETMCEERGAEAYFPPMEYCTDNGAMVAHQGLLQLESGDTVEVEDSQVDPAWRPDEVEVTWR